METNSSDTLTRAEQIERFGLDCGEGLIWRKWEPGGEYPKKLVVRNVTTKTQKFKYKLPATKFFGMDFPSTIVLSAGMSCALDITFRPIHRKAYEDFVELAVEGAGTLRVPVKAVLPTKSLSISPNMIDFGNCPTQEPTVQSVSITNDGDVDFAYSWEVAKPFIISPSEGQLKAGQSTTCTIMFKVPEASVYEASAVCRASADSDSSQILMLKATSKYPYLKISTPGTKDTTTTAPQPVGAVPAIPTVDFGEVLVGKTAERTFTIANPSEVRSTFRIKRTASEYDPCFIFSTMSGVLLAGESLDIRVVYTPTTATMYSADTYEISSPGGNSVKLQCVGTGTGPQVTLSTRSLNFGSVEISPKPGSTTAVGRVLYIRNGSPVPVDFQFFSEPDGAFAIEPTQGSISAMLSTAVTVRFAPTDPINYYKRIFCFVKNQPYPLFVDVIGTGYTARNRPPPLTQQHVDMTKRRAALGLDVIPPEQLETMETARATAADQPHPTPTELEIADEFFDPPASMPVSLSERIVDFGGCTAFSPVDYKTVTVTNNTQGKITVVWVSPGETAGEQPVFVVFPKSADIAPRSTLSFRIGFRPTQSGKFYGRMLECFANFKTMRNFRLVTDKSITAPWCLSLLAIGHTYGSDGSETFLPQVTLSSTRVNFPPCQVGQRAYQTLQLANTGNTTVKFQISEPPPAPGTTPAFAMRPLAGVLNPNQFVLLFARFAPTNVVHYHQSLKIVLNNSIANALEVSLLGSGFAPRLALENDGKIYFKPTCLGTTTVRQYTITNPSRIHVAYHWNIPEKYLDVLSISPLSGVLQPNQSLALSARFSPKKLSTYNFKATCMVNARGTPSPLTTSISGALRYTLAVFGEGTRLAIELEPQLVSFENVLIGNCEKREIVLRNPSDGAVAYQLKLKKEIFDNDLERVRVSSPNVLAKELEVIPTEGSIPARSSATVEILFRPYRKIFYTFSLVCRSSTSSDAVDDSEVVSFSGTVDDTTLPTCEIVGYGTYPTLSIVDVRSEYASRACIWRLLNIDALNRELSSDPDPKEESMIARELAAHPTGWTLIRPNATSRLFDLGAGEVGSQSSTTVVRLRNSGPLPLEWSAAFANDIPLISQRDTVWLAHDLTSMAPTEVTAEASKQEFILKQKLFAVVPKSGKLAPGEEADVALSYRHVSAGEHQTPLIIRVRDGKQVVLCLRGVTTPAGDGYLHFTYLKFRLDSLPIGERHPPRQYIPLRNFGNAAIEYLIDTSPLQRLTQENFDIPILACECPRGIVPAGGATFVPFVFTPLEAKEYAVDIPIMTIGGSAPTAITVIGRGFHPRDVDETLLDDVSDDVAVAVDNCPPAPAIPLWRLQTWLLNSPESTFASLSIEKISFGHVPTFSVNRRIVVIRNVSQPICNITFRWDLPPVLSAYVNVVPAAGQLSPQEAVVCTVTLRAGSQSELFDIDMACVFENADEITKRRTTAARHERRLAELQAEAENTIAIDRSAGRLPGRPSPSRKSSLLSAGKSNGMLSRGSIMSESADMLLSMPTSTVDGRLGAIVQQLADTEKDSGSLRGNPIITATAHVCVRARVVDVDEYKLKHSQAEIDTVFFSPTLTPLRCLVPAARSGKSDAKLHTEAATSSSDAVDELIKQTVFRMLQEVVYAADVRRAAEELDSEPIPYYRQLVERECRTQQESGAEEETTSKKHDDERLPVGVSTLSGGNQQPSSAVTEPSQRSFHLVEFADAIEQALEMTIFGLLCEANEGKFDLLHPPIQVVRLT